MLLMLLQSVYDTFLENDTYAKPFETRMNAKSTTWHMFLINKK